MMYDFAQSERPWPDTQIPPMEDVVEYYTSRAPEQLRVPPEVIGSLPSPLPFRRHLVTFRGMLTPPAVSHVKLVRLLSNEPPQLLISDMRHGIVALWTPARPEE
ncbi:MAG: hypothetical protein ACC645_13630, partial [Pirellulales bacterium]